MNPITVSLLFISSLMSPDGHVKKKVRLRFKLE